MNLLFITSDQQRGDCYGFEGRRVKTPHLDRLAREGTRFSACITPNLVCQPSRASILTGLLPYTHGVSDNGIDLDPKAGEAGFAGAFAREGYRTGYIGKAHFATSHTFKATGTPECRNSDQPQDWFGPYMGFEHVELVVEGHNHWPPMQPPRGQHYERWFHKDGRGEALQRLYETQLEPRSSAMQTFHSALPPAFHNSTWVGDRTIEFLSKNQNSKFCIWASFPDPHHPFDAPDPWSRMHHPDEVDLPPQRTLDLERRPWWHRQSLEGQPQIEARLRRIREEYSRIPQHSDRQLRELIANYYGMVSLIDHNVGRILLHLEAFDLLKNTLIVYSTDHGDWLGDHGLILKGPMAYEGLLRVGLIMQGPGIPQGKIVADPVSTVDLPATFADYAGVDFQPKHSTSLKKLIQGKGGRDFAYSEWDLRASRSGVDLDLRTVRTKTHKLTVDMRSGAGELYDLVNDPHEMDNRFNDPGAKSVQHQLTDMIRSRPQDIGPRLPQVGMA
ncbi:MAG: sulfatase-like hydrolase/transferase [Betaproteobacteria bacterium]